MSIVNIKKTQNVFLFFFSSSEKCVLLGVSQTESGDYIQISYLTITSDHFYHTSFTIYPKSNKAKLKLCLLR